MESVIFNIKTSPFSDFTSIYTDVVATLTPDFKQFIDIDKICLKNEEALANYYFSSTSHSFKEALESLNYRIRNENNIIKNKPSVSKELFKIYRLLVCCLDVSNAKFDITSMRYRISLIKYYVQWEYYQEAKEEGLYVVARFRNYIGADNNGMVDVMIEDDDDGEEIVTLVVSMMMEVAPIVLGCVANVEFQQDNYVTSLAMLKQIQPWLLRVDDQDQCDKFHTLVATYLTKCTTFLAQKHAEFPELFLEFCLQTFREHTKLESNADHIQKSWSTIFKELSSQSEPEFFLQVLDLLVNEYKNGEEKTRLVFLDVAHNLAKESLNVKIGESVANRFNELAEQFNESLPAQLILKLYAVALLVNSAEGGRWMTYQKSLSHVLYSLKQCFVSNEIRSEIYLPYLPLYFNALTFLCEPLFLLINDNCEDILCGTEETHSSMMLTMIDEALMHFIDFFWAYSALEKKRVLYTNIAAAAIAVFTLSPKTNRPLEDSVTILRKLILDDRVPANELKFLFVSLDNLARLLKKSNRLKEATCSLELSSEASWKCVLHSCKMFISKESSYREVDIAGVVKEAVARSVTMLKLPDQSGTEIEERIELFIGRWFDAHCEYRRIPRPVDLVKSWVEILREAEASIPLHSLMELIQKQKAYTNMMLRDPKLAKIIEQMISNVIVEEICTESEGPLHDAWNLIAKGREQRAQGFVSLKDCIESLSRAITMLNENKNKGDSGPNCLLLAEAYGLRALCKHEAEPTTKSYVQDIKEALALWSTKEYVKFVEETKLVFHDRFNLLYRFTDLLSLKVYEKDLHLKVYELMIKSSDNKDECLSMLWHSRSLSHALCPSPLSEVFTRAWTELDGDMSREHWACCMKTSPLLEAGFKHSFSVDSGFASPSYDNDWRKTTDQLKEAACGLTRGSPSMQSMFLASHLYYDLGERLLAKGRTVEALCYAEEANRLRLICFDSIFTCYIKKYDSKVLDNGVSASRHNAKVKYFNMNSSAATSAWEHDYQDHILTPYNILRCYLESTLQVGTTREILGYSKTAEELLVWGKAVSLFQGLPMFVVSFSRALAKIYRKQKLYDLAKNELVGAKKAFEESCRLLSCSKCSFLLGATVDEEFGEFLRSNDELELAQGFYDTAETNLKDSEWENCNSNPENTNESDELLCDASMNCEKGVSILTCWHCASCAVLESKLLESIIQMKWEHTRRRLLLGLLIKRGKIFMVEGDMENAHKVLLECISLLVSRSTFCPLHPSVSFKFLATLIEKNVIGDVFAIEKASLLYLISLFSVSNFIDKVDRCIPTLKIVHVLKLAFILSREVPELLQKVSRLLCVIYTLPPARNQLLIPSSSDNVCESHWASFFLQMTIGTNYSYKLLSRNYMKKNENAMDDDDDLSCGRSSSVSMSSRRLVPESVKDFEGFVLDFFQNLPRATVICMTVFKDALLGDLLGGRETKESAWIIFSRLSSDCAPLIVVRAIEPIQEEPSPNALGKSDGTAKIPWGYNIIDEIAPHFREFI